MRCVLSDYYSPLALCGQGFLMVRYREAPRAQERDAISRTSPRCDVDC